MIHWTGEHSKVIRRLVQPKDLFYMRMSQSHQPSRGQEPCHLDSLASLKEFIEGHDAFEPYPKDETMGGGKHAAATCQKSRPRSRLCTSHPTDALDRNTDIKQQRANQAIAALADMFSVELGPSIPLERISSDGGARASSPPDSGDATEAWSRPPLHPDPLPRHHHHEPLKSSLKTQASLIVPVDHDTTSRRRQRRVVTFGALNTRVYSVALSDHPSCSYGPPIALGWEYQDEGTVDVEDYEQQRLPRRKLDQLVLSCQTRMHLLVKRGGYSTAELREAMLESDRVKRERLFTDIFSPATSFVDEALENLIHRLQCFWQKPPRLLS